MTHQADTGGTWRDDQDAYTRRQSGWVGWVVFGAMMLLLLGAFHVLVGLVAVFRDQVFVAGRNQMPVDMDYGTWGGIHLVVGAIALVVGAAVLRGQLWARLLAAWFAFLSAMVNLAFLPAYPLWSALMIGLDVVVIWAVVVHGGELRRGPLDDE